jgi:predicted Ser/Thr protein kinase
MQGTILSNRYFIAEEIGIGGMGVVYRAVHLRTGGDVAVKVLHTFLARDDAYIRRLSREAQIAAAISSPRVVRIIDVDTHEGMPYLVMEYVPGDTLAQVIRQRGRFTLYETVAVGLEVARALDAAHIKGVVHRDLKPQNIKLVDGEVKVLDFGIAKGEGYANVTAVSAFIGTPEYCAPERGEGEGDIRSDIYSLGVILFEMHEGQLPFQAASPFALLRKHETEPPPPLSGDVPAEVQAVVARCLAKTPAERYQTPRELVHVLRGLLQTSVATLLLPEGVAPVIDDPRLSDSGVRTISAALLSEPPAALASRDPAASGRLAAPDVVQPRPRTHHRRLSIVALIAVAALILLAGGIAELLALRNDEQDPPTARGDVGNGTAALLVPGQRINVEKAVKLPEIGGPDCMGVELLITMRSVQVEPSGRVVVAYDMEAPRLPDVPQCGLGYMADAGCTCVLLETRHASGEVAQAWNTGGGGVAATGASDVYGVGRLEGEWWFDNVDLNGAVLTLQREYAGYRYRIDLISR